MADTGQLLGLAAIGIGGYFVYTKFFAGVPSDAGYIQSVNQGASFTIPANMSATGAAQSITGLAYIYYSPSTKLMYSSTTAPTAAQVTQGQAIVGTPASTPTQPATTATIPGNATTSGGAMPVTITPTPTPASSAAAVYNALLASVQGDPQFTGSGASTSATPYQWNFYLGLLVTNPTLPDPAILFNVDPAQQMTLATYWAGMLAWLKSNAGLSGLGDLAPMISIPVMGYGSLFQAPSGLSGFGDAGDQPVPPPPLIANSNALLRGANTTTVASSILAPDGGLPPAVSPDDAQQTGLPAGPVTFLPAMPSIVPPAQPPATTQPADGFNCQIGQWAADNPVTAVAVAIGLYLLVKPRRARA